MELDTEYDLIVLGTGFVESVIAGAAARSGKKVLHLDHNDYYGGYASSNTLSGFEKMITTTHDGINTQPDKWPSQSYTCVPADINPAPKFSNVKIYTYDPPKTTTTTETSTTTNEETKKETTNTENAEKQESSSNEEKKEEVETKKEENLRSNFETRDKVMATSRHYSIDTIPRLLFSRGEMVNLLISSSVGRYLEFKCFEKTFLLTKDGIQPVPCSKGDIFKSKYITNSERRMLTRFMQLIHNDLTENGKIDQSAFGSFYEFIKAQKISPNLEMFVLYAISMCTDDQQSSASKVSVAEGLRILETYISSVSKYGNTPFLCPMYGVSELPQAFCRLCAVYAGVYVLRRSVQCVLVDSQTNQFKGIVCSEGQTMKANHLVSTGSYFPKLLGDNPKISRSSRCVAISSGPVIHVDGENESNSTLLIIPPLSPVYNLNNPNAIHILQFDNSLSVSARGKYVLHFSTAASGTAEHDLERAVSYFLNVPQMTDSELVATKPFAHYVGYFNMNTFTPTAPSTPTYPQNLYLVTEGPTSFTMPDYKEELEEAKQVFSLMYSASEEFLPKVPNPEDIIWRGATEEGTTTQTETTNNGNGEAETVEGEKESQASDEAEEKKEATNSQ